MMNTLIDLIDVGVSDEVLDTVIADILENNGCDEEGDRYLVALAWGRDRNGPGHIGPEDVQVEENDEIRIGGETYRVLNEHDKEEAWEEALESTGSECVDGYNGPYFDREKWKRDARMDGVGHALSPYDHNVNEYSVDRPNGTVWFFLFRTS